MGTGRIGEFYFGLEPFHRPEAADKRGRRGFT